jgi:phospholipase C
MANPAVRAAHIQDTLNLYSDIRGGTLPAVSIVKPSGLVDGHPASSKLNLFEGFTQKIVDMVQNSPYWKDTAIFITEDEGGGYYDSGYVQPQRAGVSHTTIRITSPSSNSSSETGICLPSHTAAGIISPTRSHSRKTHTYRLTAPRSVTYLNCSISGHKWEAAANK